MIFPNKVTTYNQSVISKLPIILDLIYGGETNIYNLYMLTKDSFDEINDFIYTIDILFLLDKIIKIEGDELYVKTNK